MLNEIYKAVLIDAAAIKIASDIAVNGHCWQKAEVLRPLPGDFVRNNLGFRCITPLSFVDS